MQAGLFEHAGEPAGVARGQPLRPVRGLYATHRDHPVLIMEHFTSWRKPRCDVVQLQLEAGPEGATHSLAKRSIQTVPAEELRGEEGWVRDRGSDVGLEAGSRKSLKKDIDLRPSNPSSPRCGQTLHCRLHQEEKGVVQADVGSRDKAM